VPKRWIRTPNGFAENVLLSHVMAFTGMSLS